jgi:hypothetical protein
LWGYGLPASATNYVTERISNASYNPEIINKLKTRDCHTYSWENKNGEVSCVDETNIYT